MFKREVTYRVDLNIWSAKKASPNQACLKNLSIYKYHLRNNLVFLISHDDDHNIDQNNQRCHQKYIAII